MERGLELRGLSGDSLRLKHGKVVKRSADNKDRLLQSFLMQNSFNAYPLKVCPAYDFSKGDRFWSFSMMYLGEHDLYKNEITNKDQDKILDFLTHDLGELFDFRPLFKEKVSRIRSERYRDILTGILSEIDTKIPKGRYHGDFGPANMIKFENEIYLIDFTPTDIKTPLYDVSVLLNTLLRHGDSDKMELAEKIFYRFEEYLPAIDFMSKLRVASFYKEENTKEHKDDLCQMFYQKMR